MTVRPMAKALSFACCLLACGPVAAQLAGTLFTSPAQREYLDYLRQDFLARSSERGFDISDAEIPDIPVAVAAAQESEGPVFYTLGGIVTLRDGTQRIWLNGNTLSEAELPSEARLVRDNGAPALRFTTGTGSYVLRPGQTLELTAGSVIENYQRSVAPEVPDSLSAAVLPSGTDVPAPVDTAINTDRPAGAGTPPESASEQAAPAQESGEELQNLLESIQPLDGTSDG